MAMNDEAVRTAWLVHTHHHHHHRLNVRVSALARVGRFPMMPLLQISRSCASSFLSFNFFYVICYTLLPILLPLPRPFFPATTRFLHADTQSSESFRSTCPNHLNVPWRTLSATLTIPNLCRSFSLGFLFFRVTPHIHSCSPLFRDASCPPPTLL